MGPWRAVQIALSTYLEHTKISTITGIRIELFGALAKTGKGHGTDLAVILGLSGKDPVTIDTGSIHALIGAIRRKKRIRLMGTHTIEFDPEKHIVFNRKKQLPFHPNALTLQILLANGKIKKETWYSIGGGFVVQVKIKAKTPDIVLSYPIDKASDLLQWCRQEKKSVSEIVFENEKAWRPPEAINRDLMKIWQAMKESVYKGCHSEGILPGGLEVHRRASYQNRKMIASMKYKDPDAWIDMIKNEPHTFLETLNWVSCFALAVNEENAAFGRVVTAPTNGAAGVIPAVLLYYHCFCDLPNDPDPVKFLLVAGEIGSIFKKGATISAAMGGCQAEIGVSSAMAAAALTECLGGSPEEVLMAAEIAMEHHLGLTCDPVDGLVQIPCIERNAMGAMKAITSAHIALASDPFYARVSLDDVINTMWQTAKDMHSKYKETSEGGLAVALPVSHPDC
jgi:L-serine dehydratase